MSFAKERGDRDLEEYVRSAMDDLQARMWTGSPGIVKSYDPAKQTISVQLSVKAVRRKPDGSTEHVSIPVLQDVPVQFPGSGGVKMTFPVKPGDECYVTFASRSPDSWQQSGGEQAPVDAGMHSLSGGFAMLGFSSNLKAKELAGGADPDAVQLRSVDGQSSISLKPGGAITMKNKTVSLALSENGLDITNGYIKHNGKRIDDQHVHDGIVPGGANTGFPQT